MSLGSGFGSWPSPVVLRWVGVVLLCLPLAWSRPGEMGSWPRVHGGDEPHYLVQLHSLLSDGDFDLADDYESADRGGIEAGEAFSGRLPDRHVTWFENGTRQPGTDRPWTESPTGQPEYSTHPPGLALLLGSVLWPLRGTIWLEPASVVLTILVTVAAFLAFGRLARALGASDRDAEWLALAAFLGTPAWSYGRSLFGEGWLVALLVAAATLIVASDGTGRGVGRVAAAGAAIGAGVLIKPPFLLVGAPLAALLWWRGQRRAALAFSATAGIGVVGLLAYNAWVFGAPWHSAQPFQTGSPLVGLWGLLTDPARGVVWFAPVALAGGLLWRRLVRRSGAAAIALGASAALWILFMAFWWAWHGAYCYGPRLIVPVLPLLVLGWLPVLSPEDPRAAPRTAWWRRAFLAVTAASVLVNALGAMPYWRWWSANPWLAYGERLVELLGA